MTQHKGPLSLIINLFVVLALLAGCAAGTVPAAPPADTGAEATAAAAAEDADAAAAPQAAGDLKILTIGREGNNAFNRNFNPFSPNALVGTQTAIYERLIIFNPVTGEILPWLATEWAWGEDGTTLTFTVRDDVKWSDGEPFSAADVASTFQILKDSFAGGGYPYVESVTAPDAQTVVFQFSRPFSPALYEVGQQVIAPEHIWKDVAEPEMFTNENPVGTGPFTEVAVFQPQVFELHKNPHYWQEGKPLFDGIRYPAFPGNDQVQLALVNGEIDWADIFIPDIENTFVARSPEHHYWFAPTGMMVLFTLNTTKAPFDDPILRKAISKAINREQVVQIGMFNYTHPATDATGLSDAYDGWRDPAAVPEGGDWTKLDVEGANQMLDEAGYTRGADGIRLDKDGNPIKFEILVGAASTDWVANSQVIAQNLKEIGLDVSVRGQDWGLVIEQVQKGEFDAAHLWSGHGPTPYNFYRWAMSCDVVQPVGEVANENFARFCSEEATALLNQFEASFDEAEQREIVNQLQALFVENAPVIPLFPSPEWGEFNTTRFTGFPTADDPYALLQSRFPTAPIVLTTVQPK